MKISLGLTTSLSIKKGLKYATLADRAGFNRVFVWEDISSREVFTYLSIIALNTSKLGVATGITSPYVRHIAVIASNALALQHISSKGFTLGLGVGRIPELKSFLGEEPKKPVSVMSDAVMLLRRMFRGEVVDYEGLLGRLHKWRLITRGVEAPKIYFGVRGERLLRLAGQVADGVIFTGSKDYLKKALRLVEESATNSRRAGEVDSVVWECFVLLEDRKDLELGRLVVARIVSSLPEREFEGDEELLFKVSEIREEFARGRYEQAKRLVSEELMRRFCLAGSLEEILEEVAKLEKLGFEEFVVGPLFGRDPVKTISAFEAFSKDG